MNLVETYVSNITIHTEKNGEHYIKADFNCYGHKEYQIIKILSYEQYMSVIKNGYYLG